MTEKTPQPAQSLIKALRWQLRPLVKLLIKSGLTYPLFAELLKELFIDVADQNFKLQGKEQTDSRINFLTGIHRKDVKRLRAQESDDSFPEAATLGALLVAKWIGDDQFLDHQQQPLPLPRLIKQGGDQSFEALVISVNKDIRSRAVLDEWLHLGVVTIDKEDRVCLNKDAFIPEQGYDEKAWFFGENLHDHLAAATHNMLSEQPPFLERAVFYDKLSDNSINELKSLTEQSGMRLLRKINRRALELQTEDKTSTPDNNQRMRFGIFFYSESDASESDPGQHDSHEE